MAQVSNTAVACITFTVVSVGFRACTFVNRLKTYAHSTDSTQWTPLFYYATVNGLALVKLFLAAQRFHSLRLHTLLTSLPNSTIELLRLLPAG
jgi:hypothetical protein